ncbi:MAG: GNAT family N-acetyltransferase [Spirochaetia bacterium]
MEEIRLIKDKKAEDQYTQIAHYCFTDDIGWTDHIFPLGFGDTGYGCYEGEQLVTGAITRNFEVNLLGTILRMSGISIVESAPHVRNKGYVRKIMFRIIQEDRKRGMVLSSLRPFKFSYYEKFGYGYLGGTHFSSFRPDNIALPDPHTGSIVPFDGSEKQLKDMYDCHDRWVGTWSFGIVSRRVTAAALTEELARQKDHLFLYYRDGLCRGYIRITLKATAQYVFELTVKKTAWDDADAFQALMNLIRNHRDQVREARWFIPPSIPIQLCMKNPRITGSVMADYMARPLDVTALLDLKTRRSPVRGKVVFSIQDEILPDNTATYSLSGTEIKKADFRDENTLPLPVFSSLLFGAYSLEDAELAGTAPTGMGDAAREFFRKDPRIYLSEYF